MSLEVIGAGFGRTGTLSMKVALELLGFERTHHMDDVLRSRAQTRLWHDVASGQPPDWDQIFDGFRASVDFPSSTYYKELLTHYPEAKVVLTVRDVDQWYSSASDTIFEMTKVAPSWLSRLVPRARLASEMASGTIWDRIFHGRFADEAYAKGVFLDYVEQVEIDIADDKLLVFQVSQGWEPLCQFLGCEIPDAPFPHVNDKQSFKRKLLAVRLVALMPWLLMSIVAAVAVVLMLS